MPSIKDFDIKKSGSKKETSAETTADTSSDGPKRAQRRPGREKAAEETTVSASSATAAESLDDVKVVDVETGETMSENTNTQQQDIGASAEASQTPEGRPSDSVEIKFPGSEILRAKFSKPFEVAESIATEWMNDGKFEGLPLGHPLAQYFAAKGLQKAKQVEKKVLESPVTEKVAMQALQAGMKAQEIISQVRSKVKK